MSLTDQLLKRAIGQLTNTAAKSTGVPPNAAETLLPAAIAMIMSGIQKNVSTPGGAEALSKALGRHDGSLLDNPAHADGDAVISDGERILSHVLGARQPTIAAALAKAGGVNQDQAIKLLAMAAPAVLASLGQAKRAGGLDAAALASLVNKEAEATRRHTPSELSGLINLLDANNDGNVLDDLAGIATKALGGMFTKR